MAESGPPRRILNMLNFLNYSPIVPINVPKARDARVSNAPEPLASGSLRKLRCVDIHAISENILEATLDAQPLDVTPDVSKMSRLMVEAMILGRAVAFNDQHRFGFGRTGMALEEVDPILLTCLFDERTHQSRNSSRFPGCSLNHPMTYFMEASLKSFFAAPSAGRDDWWTSISQC